MKTNLFLFILLLLSNIKAYGQKNVYLYLKDNTRIEISVGETPKLTYGNNCVSIKSASLNLEYPISTIDRISFDANYNGLETLETADEDVFIGINDKHIIFRGFPSASTVNVYTISGQKYADYTMDNNGYISISIDVFPTGIYLFRINQLSYKLIKK